MKADGSGSALIYTGAHQPGLYEVEAQTPDGPVPSLFAVNLAKGEGYDIRPRPDRDLSASASDFTATGQANESAESGSTQAAAKTPEYGRRELWWYLAHAGLTILLIEWAYDHRRSLVQAFSTYRDGSNPPPPAKPGTKAKRRRGFPPVQLR